MEVFQGVDPREDPSVPAQVSGLSPLKGRLTKFQKNIDGASVSLVPFIAGTRAGHSRYPYSSKYQTTEPKNP